MKRNIFQNYLILLLFFIAITANAQTVSVPDLNPGSSSFGTEILVPINSSDISATYGDIIVATLAIEYDETILSYVGFDNLNPALSGLAISVNPAGANGVVQFNMEEEAFDGITWPDGKVVDVKFIFNGGNTSVDIIQAEFLESTVLDAYYPPVVNGSVSAFADISASDGDYNNKTIWTGEFGALTQPGPGHNVTITAGGTVTVATDAVANTVAIADGGQLTLNADLDVTADFTIEHGGSFLQNGLLTAANTHAELDMPAADWNNITSSWHQIASPLVGQAINGDWTPAGGSAAYQFYTWNEPTDTWFNQLEHPEINTFNAGHGYLVAYKDAGTKTFSGAFNIADVSVMLTNQGTGVSGEYDAGANLLGNPYPVALTWENSWIPAGVQATAYIWSGSSYTDIVSGELIPALNGFMVLTTNDNNAITIPASSRAYNVPASTRSATSGIKLVANDLQAGSQQSTRINFNSEATEGYDLAYDAFYMSGYAPQFYTMAGQSALMVNSMPIMEEDSKIPLYFEKTEAKNFSIQLTENNMSIPVYLTDLKLNNTVKLSEIMEYHFSAEAGDSPERFEVFFSTLGVDELTEAQAGAYVLDNSIVVYGLTGSTSVELYNLAGQLVYATQTSGNTSQFEINTGLKQGVYIVKLSDQAATNSVKVFIQ